MPTSLPFKARRLLKRVQTYAAQHTLWPEKSHILIAVSGGPDSVCLLDMLLFLRPRHSFSLALTHVNYQLRGKDSLSDERFVRTLAQKHSLPCFVKRYPKTSHKHDEKTLRDFRYAFFETLAKKYGFSTIALGHQENDQAETFLLNLIRGSGPLGLAGMLPKNGRYIRPLLTLNREDILQYLSARNLPFQTDASNHDTRYTRNRVRQELIPFIQKRFNPSIVSTLAHSASLFRLTTKTSPEASSLCPIHYDHNTASFSQTAFLLLSSSQQRSLLHNAIQALSGKTASLGRAPMDTFTKAIQSTKPRHATVTIQTLKLTRKNATVFLTYSPS